MKKHLKDQAGQTLIEVVVAIGVALVIISSLVALMNASSRRSTLARQATQASKLAQEGAEIVRNIRDVGGGDVVRVGTSTSNPFCSVSPFCSWNDLYTSTQGTRTAFLQKPSDCGVTESWCLVNTQPSYENTLLGIFNRSVVISDQASASGTICSDLPLPATQTKKVTVIVSWHSPIGDQERKAETCFTKWR